MSDRERAPDAAGEMDRDRADRIIDLDLVEEDARSRPRACTGDEDRRGSPMTGLMTSAPAVMPTRPCQDAVQGHREVGLRADEGIRDHRADSACSCGETGRHEHEGRCSSRIRRQDRTAVETEPSEPQQEDADRRERHRRATGHRGCIAAVLSRTSRGAARGRGRRSARPSHRPNAPASSRRSRRSPAPSRKPPPHFQEPAIV